MKSKKICIRLEDSLKHQNNSQKWLNLHKFSKHKMSKNNREKHCSKKDPFLIKYTQNLSKSFTTIYTSIPKRRAWSLTRAFIKLNWVQSRKRSAVTSRNLLSLISIHQCTNPFLIRSQKATDRMMSFWLQRSTIISRHSITTNGEESKDCWTKAMFTSWKKVSIADLI